MQTVPTLEKEIPSFITSALAELPVTEHRRASMIVLTNAGVRILPALEDAEQTMLKLAFLLENLNGQGDIADTTAIKKAAEFTRAAILKFMECVGA